MSARHKAIVETVNDAMRRMDIEGFLACCADDFVWTMVGDAPIRGKDALRTMMGGARASRRPSPSTPWSPTATSSWRRAT